MKITTLSGITPSAGGVFYAVNSLCKALVRQDVDVSVLGSEDKTSQEDLALWEPVSISLYKSYGPLKSSLTLRRLLRNSGADLVHQHGIWLDDQWATLQWQRRTGNPVVISPHGMLDPWAVQNAAWKKKLVGWLFANESLRNASCIHALCQSEAESIRAYGLENPIAVIPNGIDLPDFDRSTCTLQRSTKRHRLLFLGRIHPKKGLKELMEAWCMVQDINRSAWELIIAGWDDGGHLDGLKKQATELGLGWSDHDLGSEYDSLPCTLHFVGPKFGTEKDTLLRTVDAFILPSFSEGLPMSVLEAWAYGLPVIMTPQCNIPEGFSVNAAMRTTPEVKSIAEGLRKLMQLNDNELAGIGYQGYQLVRDKFTWPIIADQMITVYRWVLGQGPRPDCVMIQ